MRNSRLQFRRASLALVASLVSVLLSLTADPTTASGPGPTVIATGNAHACVVTAAGDVWCWGANGAGQLGDGTTMDRSAPVRVAGLESPIVSLATGAAHTCALSVEGEVWCWGGNIYGSLGVESADTCVADWSFDCSLTPLEVPHLGASVTAISSGPAAYHTCALTNSRDVKCWGNNNRGQLGNGELRGSSMAPVDVLGLNGNTIVIGAGGEHTCAITASGAVKCWGSNLYGELGDGTSGPGTGRSMPVDVGGLDCCVSAVDVGFHHTCALAQTGRAYCWGMSMFVGNGGVGSQPEATPVQVAELGSGVARISAASWHTCAQTAEGGAKCWGQNKLGQLGDGTLDDWRFTPLDVVGLGVGLTAISAGGQFTCAITAAGGVKCWGNTSSGRLGSGTADEGPGSGNPAPKDVIGLAPKPTEIPGDVDCSGGSVTPVDAALILQYEAGVIHTLLCEQNADVSQDQIVNSVDALLLLQFNAGLIECLPPDTCL